MVKIGWKRIDFEWENWRVGEWESLRVGELENGRVGEFENGRSCFFKKLKLIFENCFLEAIGL